MAAVQMKAELNAKQTRKTNIDVKIYDNSHLNKTNCTNSQVKRGRKLPDVSTRNRLVCSQVLLCGHSANSTSVKKEINGPGASEWMHSQ